MIDKKVAIILGAIVGAVLGASVGYAYARVDAKAATSGLTRTEVASRQIDTADYFKLGLAVLGAFFHYITRGPKEEEPGGKA